MTFELKRKKKTNFIFFIYFFYFSTPKKYFKMGEKLHFELKKKNYLFSFIFSTPKNI